MKPHLSSFLVLGNKYFIGTHISEAKFRQILKEFCRDCVASKTADRVSISRPTINTIHMLLRKRIYELTINNNEKISDEVEIDESYFGARRVRGKRGRGASGKVPVFGILKRNGEVHTTIVKNCSKAQLLPILKGKVLEDLISLMEFTKNIFTFISKNVSFVLITEMTICMLYFYQKLREIHLGFCAKVI